MNIEIYNDWYVRTDGRIGPWNITTTQQASAEQIHNAYKIYSAFLNDGWTLNAISATLGNMQHESSLDPALIEQTNRRRLPNSAANLSDVPNAVMQNHYKEYYTGISGSGGYGIGLVQWDGKGITRQKLVGYCENNGYVWYDGDAQIQRIFYEKTKKSSTRSYASRCCFVYSLNRPTIRQVDYCLFVVSYPVNVIFLWEYCCIVRVFCPAAADCRVNKHVLRFVETRKLTNVN